MTRKRPSGEMSIAENPLMIWRPEVSRPLLDQTYAPVGDVQAPQHRLAHESTAGDIQPLMVRREADVIEVGSVVYMRRQGSGAGPGGGGDLPTIPAS